MQPLNNNVLVESVEDDGVIKTVSDRNVVAIVKQLPYYTLDEENAHGWFEIEKGSKIICEQVREYLVGNERYYFTRLEDIICVLEI